MRFTLTSLFVALFAAVAMAVAPTYHSVIITFPNDAPKRLLEEAKEKVRNTDGATITHEYTIIPGFSAIIPNDLSSKIQALSSEYPPLIESDGIMTTQDNNGGDKVGF